MGLWPNLFGNFEKFAFNKKGFLHAAMPQVESHDDAVSLSEKNRRCAAKILPLRGNTGGGALRKERHPRIELRADLIYKAGGLIYVQAARDTEITAP